MVTSAARAKPRGFKKTRRQREALAILNSKRHGMLYGGSRSGKTAIAIRNVFLRAMKAPSRHLIVRFRFNHAKVSLGHETIPWVLANCFPGVPVVENKAEGFYVVPAAGGGISEVWLGGTDDKDRIEKILGNEYSTIYANECSQIPFDAIATLWTRLAESSGLEQRFYYDCNPPGKKHWTHLLFMEGRLPDGTRHKLDVGYLQMNPIHNRENLSPEYLSALDSLPKRLRQRFLSGEYLADVEGALWTDEMIVRAKLLEFGAWAKTIVAVDPSVTNNRGSDECGITVDSLDQRGLGVVRADLSGKMSTRAWAARAVAAYHAFEANYIVAEKNNGGDLVRDAIQNLDSNIKVVLVSASVGKKARAEPVSMLFEQGRVAFAGDYPLLEAELTETVFDELTESPNRLDSMVWGLHHLMVKKRGSRVHVGVVG